MYTCHDEGGKLIMGESVKSKNNPHAMGTSFMVVLGLYNNNVIRIKRKRGSHKEPQDNKRSGQLEWVNTGVVSKSLINLTYMNRGDGWEEGGNKYCWLVDHFWRDTK